VKLSKKCERKDFLHILEKYEKNVKNPKYKEKVEFVKNNEIKCAKTLPQVCLRCRVHKSGQAMYSKDYGQQH